MTKTYEQRLVAAGWYQFPRPARRNEIGFWRLDREVDGCHTLKSWWSLVLDDVAGHLAVVVVPAAGKRHVDTLARIPRRTLAKGLANYGLEV